MINIEQVYQSLRDLTTKGKGGYTDTDSFNKNSKRAELLLWQYYSQVYERERRIPEAMYPFLEDVNLSLPATGYVPIPSDYGHFILINYGKVVTVPGEAPSVSYVPAIYLSKAEQMNTIDSPIRKPDLEKKSVYYTFESDDRIKILPTGITGLAHLQYLRYPIYGVRGFTLDTVNDEQNYNAGTSTQYEWPQQEENNLVDLLLWFDGIIIRDSEILNWARGTTTVSKEIIQ